MSHSTESARWRGFVLILADEQSRERGVVIPGQRLRLGRDPSNDVVVSDPQASRRHATLWWQHGRCYVRDEGSANGTWLNDRKVVEDQPLRVGDRLRIGSTTFELKEGQQRQARGWKKRPSVSLAVALVGGGSLVLLLLVVLWLSHPSGVAFPPPLPVPSPGAPRAVAPSALPTAVRATPTFTPAPMPSTPTSAAMAAATSVAMPVPSAGRLRDRALLAAVVLFVPVDGTDDFSIGSGSIVSSKGHILTNFHIVGDVETGKLYNADRLAFVGVNSSDLSKPPEITYIAELVEVDAELDLALLRVSALRSGDPLPAGVSLTSVPISDSDAVEVGEAISIIGFPELGGATVTLTRGTVSGFHGQAPHVHAWIKTDTEISPGNSGGMALNEQWELIGIPTVITAWEEVSGKIGWIRPIKLAQPLLRSAR